MRSQSEVNEMKQHVGDYDCVLSTVSDYDDLLGVWLKQELSGVVAFNVNNLIGDDWANVLELGLDLSLYETTRRIDLMQFWNDRHSGFDLRLPYKRCFISFRHSGSIYSVIATAYNDPPLIKLRPVHIDGEILRDWDSESGEIIGYSFAPGEGQLRNEPDSSWINLFLNEDGTLSDMDAGFLIGESDDVVCFSICLYAMSALNCRNIELVDQPLPPSNIQATYEREYGKPMTTYKTLKIKNTHKVYPDTDRDGENESHSHKRLHLVRGHAVRYTEEAPRFGRDVGTFWRSAHVRGDETIGTVVKDYELPPAAPDAEREDVR